MKTCNVYIFSLEDDEQHRAMVRETLRAIRAIKLEPGELYIPRTFIFEDATEEPLSKTISECKYGRPDIIVSIGLSITQSLAELYKKIEPVSTIFIGIYDPVANGLVHSLERPGGYMSGVRRGAPCSQEFIREKFKPLVPAIQKIFMPYDTRLNQPLFSIEVVVRNLAKEFQGLGCEVILQGVHGSKEAIEVVKKQLASVHAVAGFGLHFDTERAVSYACGMSKRVFISDRDEFGFENGAALTVMFEKPMLLYTSVVQMIRNFWWHRKTPSTQAVVTVHLDPKHIVVNRFMLPYWASYIADVILADESKTTVTNYWPDGPLDFDDRRAAQEGINVENDRKLDRLLDQLFLLQDCLF
jgi:hypothetical protein